MLDLSSHVVLITGADGGIGTALVKELLEKNIKKVYATGLFFEKLEALFHSFSDKVIGLPLDITNDESIANCVLQTQDVTILINNAGIELKVPFLEENSAKMALLEMNVNYIGLIKMVTAYLPSLEEKIESSVVNILSIGSLAIIKNLATYCTSKAAAHLFTETIREEINAKGINLSAVYMGYVDTKMTPDNVPKSNPQNIAIGIIEGICKKKDYIFLDELTQKFVKQNPINTFYL